MRSLPIVVLDPARHRGPRLDKGSVVLGPGSAVLIRTPSGHHVLIDAGPDPDKFLQAVGRALPPTARTIDVWLITGGRRENIGAANAVLNRFRIETIVIADPDAWSVRLRSLVQQARTDGVAVASANGPLGVDGVVFSPAGDGRSWLIQAASHQVALVSPETSWQFLSMDIEGAIFTSGGPAEWQGPGRGFSVVQVAAVSRQGCRCDRSSGR